MRAPPVFAGCGPLERWQGLPGPGSCVYSAVALPTSIFARVKLRANLGADNYAQVCPL